MTARQRRFWLPMLGLGAFFVSVVVAVNAILVAVHSPRAGSPDSRTAVHSLERRVERLLRRVDRMRRAPATPPKPQSVAPGGDGYAGAFLPDPVLDDEPSTTIEEYASLQRMLSRDLDSPRTARFVCEEWSLWSLERSRAAPTFLDDLFALPGLACDGVVEGVRGWFGTTGCFSLRQEAEGPMVGRLAVLRDFERPRTAFREFALQWASRQGRVIGGDSYLRSIGFEEGYEPLDQDALLREEGKILWDVARRVYLSKYFGRAEDRIRGEMWRVTEWRGVDFLVAPPVLAAYAWFRGWDRRITAWDVRLHVKIEPLSAIARNFGRSGFDVPFAIGLEIEVPGFPIRAMAAAGLRDGEPSLDFVGIGTSLGQARKAFEVVRE